MALSRNTSGTCTSTESTMDAPELGVTEAAAEGSAAEADVVANRNHPHSSPRLRMLVGARVSLTVRRSSQQ